MGYEVKNQITAFRANLESDNPFLTNTNVDPTDIDEPLTLTKSIVVPAFGSSIVKGWTKKTMMMEHKLNMMTQAPYMEDKANLPVGLYVLRTYTEMKDSSQNVSIVMRNGTSRPIWMTGGQMIGRVVAANLVPDAEPLPEFLRKLNEDEPEQDSPKMTVAEHQAHLMEILEEKGGLNMLKSWPEKEATQASTAPHGVPQRVLIGEKQDWLYRCH